MSDAGFNLTYTKFCERQEPENIIAASFVSFLTLMLTRRSMMQSNHFQTLSQIGPELLSVSLCSA
jgi:hypothetical protein